VRVNKFKEAKKLRFDLSTIDQDYRELRMTLIYPKKHAYMEKYVSHDVYMMKLVTFSVVRRTTARVYLRRRP
ncbi:hypothetical protein KI387_036015, partial [Taxus chinensis]